MGRFWGRKPSPAMLVAIVALVFALVGTSVAGVATISVLSKKEKKQTRNIARNEIKKAAPGLSVARAANADALEGKPASAFASSASEPYHEVGTPGEPAFRNGWANAGGGFSTAAFYKDPLGVVHLKGNLSNPVTDGTDAFTLPAGYRPSQGLFMPAAGGPALGAANLVVQSDGDVIPDCEGSDSCIAGIDGLTFRVP